VRIAICDDERKDLMHLQALVNKYDSSIAVSSFESAESLLGGVKEQHCDIILLDIEMDGMNGFTAAEVLSTMKNPPLIVFVTNSGEYTYRGYEVAFRYLPKPVNYAVLADVLSAAIRKISSQKITITVEGSSHVLPIDSIHYFESFGHNLTVHTTAKDYICRTKLNEVESLLPGNSFASPHKGYLVNLDYVDTVGEDSLSLSNDVIIPISRRKKQEFERALFRFVRRSR